MAYRNPKLLAAVRLLPCVNCGVVGTQAAHSNQIQHGSGTAIKSGDNYCMALCPKCHFSLDNGNVLTKAERRLMTFEGIAESYARLMEKGLIKVV
jgi:hypothetical protein